MKKKNRYKEQKQGIVDRDKKENAYSDTNLIEMS